MDFSNRLRHLRQRYKLTQGELAEVLGLKPTAISNYESRRNEPSFEKLKLLCDYFNVSCDYILGLSDSTFRVGSLDIDKDTAEFFALYKRLNKANANEVLNYARYLLYKQENSTAATNENNSY